MSSNNKFDANSWDSCYDESSKKIKYEDDTDEIEIVHEQEDIQTDSRILVSNIVPLGSMLKEKKADIIDDDKTKKLVKIVLILILSVMLLAGLIGTGVYFYDYFGDSDSVGGDDGLRREDEVDTRNDDVGFNDETTDLHNESMDWIDESLTINGENEDATEDKINSSNYNEQTTNEYVTMNKSEFPNVIGLKEDEAMRIIRNYVDKYYPNFQEQGGYIDTIYFYKNEDNNMPKGYVYDCEHNGAICINVYVSMGDGEEAWSPWSETIDVPNGYVSTGYGSPYKVYSKVGFNDIEVEESIVHERRRLIYKDKNQNIVRTEEWSDWEVSDCWYPFNEGEEYIGYDDNTGYTKYYQTQKNKVFYRWRYCETYH